MTSYSNASATHNRWPKTLGDDDWKMKLTDVRNTWELTALIDGTILSPDNVVFIFKFYAIKYTDKTSFLWKHIHFQQFF